jgi:hypothetical protein
MSAPARRSSSRPIPAGPLAAMRPNSAPWPRIALTSCVRWRYPPLTLASQHQSRLLIRRFRRHEAHGRPACRLAQRRRVGRIVLAARHIGLGELWRDQPHLVPEPRQRAGPVMRRPACLHRHQGRRQLLEERQHLSARQLPAQRGSTFRIDPVQLKETLRRIHPNARNLVHGRLLFDEVFDKPHHGTQMPLRGRPPQQSRGCGAPKFFWIASLRSPR